MSRVEPEFQERFARLTQKTYSAQSKWWLNGFWTEPCGEAEAEAIWTFAERCTQLDKKRRGEGNELDEFEAHQFLETLGETKTVLELREKLREIDVDMNKRMALMEYLLFRYNKTVKDVVTAPQGGENKEEMAQAQSMVDAAQAAVEEMNRKLEEQRNAVEAQKKAEEEAKKQAAEAKAAEDAARAAEEENRKALAELHNQEEAYHGKIKALEEKIAKSEGVVTRGRAIAELEQLKAEDPLPLRRAKTNQEATVRKAEKARKVAEAAREHADASARAAEQATATAEESARQVEAAVEGAQQKLEEAMEYLEDVKSRPGQSYGDIWWMEREIEEKKKYLPQKKVPKP